MTVTIKSPTRACVLLCALIAGMSFSAEPTSLEKIDAARAVGTIDRVTAYRYALSILAGKDIPTEFKSEVPDSCGTPLMLQLMQDWPSLSAQDRDDLKAVWPPVAVNDCTTSEESAKAMKLAIPTLDQTYAPANGHFIIHYTLTGPDAMSTGDIPADKYIKAHYQLLEIGYKSLQQIYGRVYHNTTPMDVYYYKLNGLNGYVTGSASPVGTKCDAFIALSCDLWTKQNATYGAAYGPHTSGGTTLHELTHTVQLNYDYSEGPFMMESSATWAERTMRSGKFKTYLVDHLPHLFDTPNLQLWLTNGIRPYANGLFNQCLVEWLKVPGINAQIWTQCEATPGNNSIAAIGTVLAANGTTWQKAIRAYGAFNIMGYYKDGKLPLWQKARDYQYLVNFASSYGVEPTQSPSDATKGLREMGSHYILFDRPSNLTKTSGGELLFKLKRTAGSADATVILFKKDKPKLLVDMPTDATDPNGYYEVMIPGFATQFDSATVMVQVRTTTGTDDSIHTYTYAAACPVITLNSFLASPTELDEGLSSTLTLNFDVEGCWNTMNYPLKYKAQIRGPGSVHDGVTDLIVDVKNGLSQQDELYFTAGTGSGYVPGTYKVGVQFVFGTTAKPESKTEVKWADVVLRPNDCKASGQPNAPARLGVRRAR